MKISGKKEHKTLVPHLNDPKNSPGCKKAFLNVRNVIAFGKVCFHGNKKSVGIHQIGAYFKSVCILYSIMKVQLLILVLYLVLQVFGGKLIQRENGIWYTGKGCGSTTQIKYLNDVPEDTQDLECTFIPKKDFVQQSLTKTIEECTQEKTKNSGTLLSYQAVEKDNMKECVKLCMAEKDCVGVNGQPKPFDLGCHLLKDIGDSSPDNFHSFVSKECLS